MTDRPKWGDDTAMEAWLESQLFFLLLEEAEALQDPKAFEEFLQTKVKSSLIQRLRSGAEITLAERNELADYLERRGARFPLRRRGRPPRQERMLSDLEMAAADVRRIKQLWVKHYGQKYRVHRRALEFAAKRWNTDENMLANQARRGRVRSRCRKSN